MAQTFLAVCLILKETLTALYGKNLPFFFFFCKIIKNIFIFKAHKPTFTFIFLYTHTHKTKINNDKAHLKHNPSFFQDAFYSILDLGIHVAFAVDSNDNYEIHGKKKKLNKKK